MSLSETTLGALAAIVGRSAVLTQPEDVIPYSFDGTAALKQRPEAVVFPRTTAQVARVRSPCRGAGSADRHARIRHGPERRQRADAGQPGALPGADERHPRCRSAQPDAARAAGRHHAAHRRSRRPHGLFYPPDPGSMRISTIGGNVAENSGGLRGLKYGVTRDYVMGLEVVLPTAGSPGSATSASRMSPATR